MNNSKKKEVIISTVIAFLSTFSGVFLGVGLERNIAKTEQKKIFLNVLKVQSELCLSEYESFINTKDKKYVRLPDPEFVTLLPNFLQILSDEINPKIYKEFLKEKIQISTLYKEINSIRATTPAYLAPEPIFPSNVDPNYRNQVLEQYLEDKSNWQNAIISLDNKIDIYSKKMKSLCKKINLIN